MPSLVYGMPLLDCCYNLKWPGPLLSLSVRHRQTPYRLLICRPYLATGGRPNMPPRRGRRCSCRGSLLLTRSDECDGNDGEE